MNYFNSIKDVVEKTKDKFGINTNDNEKKDASKEMIQAESAAEDNDVLHTPDPKPRGINKKITIGVAIVCAVVFMGAFLYGMDSGNSKKKNVPVDAVPYKKIDGVEAHNATINKLPGNYQELAKYNTQAEINNKKQQQSGQQPVQPGYSNSYNSSPNHSAVVKQIPSTSYYPSERNSDYSEENNKPFVAEKTAKTVDYLTSPVRFSFAGTSKADTDKSVNVIANKNSRTSMQEPASPYVLQTGTIIPSTLITGINSDLSSKVVAQVSENVFDSVTGQYLLIPQGSRLIGECNGGSTEYGQNRIAISWKRLILPNGTSIDLEDMPGTDGAGYPGLKDKVNNHTGNLVKGVFLSSILAAGAQVAAGNTDEDDQSVGQMATSGAAQNLMNTGGRIIDRNLGINPTLEIRPGYKFNVFVTQDLVLQPWTEN